MLEEVQLRTKCAVGIKDGRLIRLDQAWRSWVPSWPVPPNFCHCLFDQCRPFDFPRNPKCCVRKRIRHETLCQKYVQSILCISVLYHFALSTPQGNDQQNSKMFDMYHIEPKQLLQLKTAVPSGCITEPNVPLSQPFGSHKGVLKQLFLFHCDEYNL